MSLKKLKKNTHNEELVIENSNKDEKNILMNYNDYIILRVTLTIKPNLHKFIKLIF